MKTTALTSRQTVILCILLAVTFVAGKFVADEASRGVKLQQQLLAVTLKRSELAAQQKLSRLHADLLLESAAYLRSYEKTIPLADGYVHVSRMVMEAAPKVTLTIDPPEITHDLVSSPEYCSGLFRLKGTGRLHDVLAILQRTERDMPFSRVQDLQIIFTDSKELKVDFTMSLLTVMRLAEDFAAAEREEAER